MAERSTAYYSQITSLGVVVLKIHCAAIPWTLSIMDMMQAWMYNADEPRQAQTLLQKTQLQPFYLDNHRALLPAQPHHQAPHSFFTCLRHLPPHQPTLQLKPRPCHVDHRQHNSYPRLSPALYYYPHTLQQHHLVCFIPAPPVSTSVQRSYQHPLIFLHPATDHRSWARSNHPS